MEERRFRGDKEHLVETYFSEVNLRQRETQTAQVKQWRVLDEEMLMEELRMQAKMRNPKSSEEEKALRAQELEQYRKFRARTGEQGKGVYHRIVEEGKQISDRDKGNKKSRQPSLSSGESWMSR